MEPLQASNKIKPRPGKIKVTNFPVLWKVINLQIRKKIQLILYKDLYEYDGAVDRNWGNVIIYALPLTVEIWPNLSWGLAKDGFLKRDFVTESIYNFLRFTLAQF